MGCTQASLGAVLSIARLWGSAAPSALGRAWCNAGEVDLNRNQVEWERRRACSCTRTRRGSRCYSYGLRVLNRRECWLRQVIICGSAQCILQNVGARQRKKSTVREKETEAHCQEDVEQIGSFKNSWWKIPARSSRKLRVNGLAKGASWKVRAHSAGSRGVSVAGRHSVGLAGQQLWQRPSTSLNIVVQQFGFKRIRQVAWTCFIFIYLFLTDKFATLI